MLNGLSIASWLVAVGGVVGGGYSVENGWLLWALVVTGVVFRFFSKWFAE